MLRKTSVAIAKLNAIETPSGTISLQCWWKNKALNTFSDCKLLFLLLSFTLCANEWMSDLAFLHLCQVKLIACNSIQLKEITRQRPRCVCVHVYSSAIYLPLCFVCVEMCYAWRCIYFTRAPNQDGTAHTHMVSELTSGSNVSVSLCSHNLHSELNPQMQALI